MSANIFSLYLPRTERCATLGSYVGSGDWNSSPYACQHFYQPSKPFPQSPLLIDLWASLVTTSWELAECYPEGTWSGLQGLG